MRGEAKGAASRQLSLSRRGRSAALRVATPFFKYLHGGVRLVVEKENRREAGGEGGKGASGERVLRA